MNRMLAGTSDVSGSSIPCTCTCSFLLCSAGFWLLPWKQCKQFGFLLSIFPCFLKFLVIEKSWQVLWQSVAICLPHNRSKKKCLPQQVNDPLCHMDPNMGPLLYYSISLLCNCNLVGKTPWPATEIVSKGLPEEANLWVIMSSKGHRIRA